MNYPIKIPNTLYYYLWAFKVRTSHKVPFRFMVCSLVMCFSAQPAGGKFWATKTVPLWVCSHCAKCGRALVTSWGAGQKSWALDLRNQNLHCNRSPGWSVSTLKFKKHGAVEHLVWVLPCRLFTDSNSSVTSNSALTPRTNNWAVLVTSVDSSRAKENHSNHLSVF